MSKLPHKLTLFNSYSSPSGVVFYKTELSGVLFFNRKQANVFESGLSSANALSITIPMNLEGYKNPADWDLLSDTDKIKYWTLKSKDIVVKGFISETSASLSDLKAKYKDVGVISVVDEFDVSAFRHWNVGAN